MKTIKLSLVAASVCTLLAMPALATDVQIYGRAHVSLDHIDNDVDSATKVSSNSSRLGFKVSHKLTDNLEALAQIEGELNYDTSNASSLTSRDTFVGLKGDFGLLRVGKFDTPLKLVRSKTDMFGDRLGDARNITRQSTPRFDERFNNSVHYQSKDMDGFKFDFVYAPDSTGTANDANNDADKMSASVSYENKAVYLALAYEMNKVATGSNPNAVRFGAYYNVSSDFRVAALYQTLSNVSGGDRDMYGVGASYKMGDYTLRGQYYLAGDNDTDNTGANLFAVGVDRSIGKALTLYAVYGMMANDDNANFNLAAQARSTTVATVAGRDQNGLSLGLQYNF